MDRYDPYLDEGMKRWIAKTARVNLWRVGSYYDLSDLVQDGYMCYYKCRDHYPELSRKTPTKDDRRHFMSLVKTTFTNHIHSLALKRQYGVEQPVSDLLSDTDNETEFWNRTMPAAPAEQELSVFLRQLPKELADLFRLLVLDGANVVNFARSRLRRTASGRPYWGRRALRETTNEHYCRRLGLDPRSVDLVAMINKLALR